MCVFFEDPSYKSVGGHESPPEKGVSTRRLLSFSPVKGFSKWEFVAVIRVLLRFLCQGNQKEHRRPKLNAPHPKMGGFP